MNTFKFLFFILLLNVSANVSAQNTIQKASVYFPFNSSEPEQESLHYLQKQLSSAHFDTLYLTAHCDARGSDFYNDSLSTKRKEAMLNWLSELRMINSETVKIIASAKGEHMPLNSNATEEERRLNRRVELSWNVIRKELTLPKVTSSIIQVDSILKAESKPVLENLSGTMSQQIERAKETGQSLVLNNINFIGGRAQFLATAAPTLKELLKVMRDNPDLRIEIQGHVCCTYDGADGPNMETGGQYLSLDRAKAVYDYLVYYGISETRLNYKGFGGSKRLVETELTEGDRTRNRRVEIVVLKD